jgi:cyanoexosortase A
MAKAKLLKYFLTFLSSTLVILHLNLTWKSENSDLIGASVLFWSAVIYLIWEKKNSLVVSHSLVPSLFGGIAIALVLLKSSSLVGNDVFLRLSPLLSGIGLALLSGGLKPYWRELSLLTIFAIPPGLVSLLVDISPLTAQFASFTLWSLGFAVSRQGVFINLPTGGIEVYPGCSGIALILQILGLAAIFLILFPSDRYQKIILPGLAIILAFLVNGGRVALLTVLAALGDRLGFKYWHLGDGSLIFSTMAVLIFGLVYCFAFQNDLQDRPMRDR